MKNVILFTQNDASAPIYNLQVTDDQAALLTADAIAYVPDPSSALLTPVALAHKAAPVITTVPAGTRNLPFTDTGSAAHFISFVAPAGGSYISAYVKVSADQSASMRVDFNPGVTGAPSDVRISRMAGETVTAYLAELVVPGGIPDGAKITFVATSDDKIMVLVNDVLVPGSAIEHPLGDETDVANPGTFVSLVDAYSANPPIDIEYGAWEPSVNITAVQITSDSRPRADITYNDAGVPPSAYEMQIETAGGRVLQAWADAVPIATSGAGFARLESARPLPIERRGSTLAIRVREKGKEEITSVAAVVFPAIRRFGENLSDGSIYYSWQAEQFRDWKDRLTWTIVDGPHALDGKNGGLFGLRALLSAGLIDRDCRLLSWPEGASKVGLADVNRPALSECGPRLLKLAPHQDFTLGVGAGTINLTKNLDTGEHVIDFVVPADGSDPLFSWSIELDQDTFVPRQSISLRKVGDDSILKLTDNFIAAMSQFSVLRLMDLLGANGGGIWDTFEDHLRWGWQPAAIAELFNRAVHPIPYFVPGFNTTPEVFAQYMQYFEATIDRSIPAFYFDPANEVWGGISGLRAEFAYRAALNGRYGDGYQPPIAAEHLHRQNNQNTTTDLAIPAGDYLLVGVSGYNYGGALFKALQSVPAGTSIPQVRDSGDATKLVSDANFEFVENMDAVHGREYGVYGRALTLAGKAVCPRLKAFAIGQLGDAVDAGGFLHLASDYAMTQGGTDTWGSVLDGYACAPYAYMQGSDHDDITNASAGDDRVAVLQSIYTARMASAPAMVKILSDSAQAYFETIGRTQSPIIMVYECGLEGKWWDPPATQPAGLAEDFKTFFNSDALMTSLEAYYKSLFDNGAANVCAYRFGPNIPEGDQQLQYGPYDHFRSVGDTTSGTARADLQTAAVYNGV